jgi:hypothetical protein
MERVTRSLRRRQEEVTAEVAALQITKDNLTEEITATNTVDDAENETYTLGTLDCIAQLPAPSYPKLVALPLSSAEPY